MSGFIALFVAGVVTPPAIRFLYRAGARALAASQSSGRPYEVYETGFPATFSRGEALEALGISTPSPSPQIIREKYRELIKDLHSDTGGSPYIARRINEARDVSLGSLVAWSADSLNSFAVNLGQPTLPLFNRIVPNPSELFLVVLSFCFRLSLRYQSKSYSYPHVGIAFFFLFVFSPLPCFAETWRGSATQKSGGRKSAVRKEVPPPPAFDFLTGVGALNAPKCSPSIAEVKTYQAVSNAAVAGKKTRRRFQTPPTPKFSKPAGEGAGGKYIRLGAGLFGIAKIPGGVQLRDTLPFPQPGPSRSAIVYNTQRICGHYFQFMLIQGKHSVIMSTLLSEEVVSILLFIYSFQDANCPYISVDKELRSEKINIKKIIKIVYAYLCIYFKLYYVYYYYYYYYINFMKYSYYLRKSRAGMLFLNLSLFGIKFNDLINGNRENICIIIAVNILYIWTNSLVTKYRCICILKILLYRENNKVFFCVFLTAGEKYILRFSICIFNVLILLVIIGSLHISIVSSVLLVNRNFMVCHFYFYLFLFFITFNYWLNYFKQFYNNHLMAVTRFCYLRRSSSRRIWVIKSIFHIPIIAPLASTPPVAIEKRYLFKFFVVAERLNKEPERNFFELPSEILVYIY
eukprot:gene3852-2730_t